jgi:hypothetical protein
MSKLIRLSEQLQLPIDIVTMRVAIFGTSDAGKTTFARLVAERVHEAKQRFCAIDLKNDWWGLKSSADGTSAGIPIVIFGGPKRDIQIFEDAGAATADTVASIEQSCVIDLDDFNKRKQLVFLTAFLNRLYDINRKPLFLLADEADRYAPQQPGMDVAYESLGASEDICRRGRKRGIGSMWITQRNAVLNKSVSNMCDLTVVFRTPGSRDLKELKDSVGRIANEEQLQAVMKAAPGLDNGQVILLSAHPKLRKFMPPGATPIQMPMPETFDSSATPRVGQRKREPKVLAKTDLAAIEAQMAQQVERAKAADPKELRKQLAQLQRDLASKAAECSRQFTEIARLKQSPGKPDPKQTIRATEVAKARRAMEEAMKFIVEITTKNFDASVPEKEVRSAIQSAVDASLKKVEAVFENRARDFADLKTKASRLLAQMKAIIESDVTAKVEVRHNEPFTVAPTLPRQQPRAPRSNVPPSGDVKLGTGERRCAIAIAQHAPANGCAREQLTTLTGFKRSTRNTYLQRLLSAGLIEQQGERFQITQPGLDWLGDFELLPTGAALQDYWLQKLPQGESAVLRVVLEHAAGIDREGIGEKTNFKRSTRNTYIQRLASRELVKVSGEIIQPSDSLFD